MIVFVEQLFDDSSEDNIIITILARFHKIMMIGVLLHEPIKWCLNKVILDQFTVTKENRYIIGINIELFFY